MISINGVPQTTMDLIRMILINQMNMQQDRVNIYDNKWVVPDIEDMFITVEYRSAKTLGNNTIFCNNATANAPTEVQVINTLEKIVVGVFSRNDEAQLRKEEVLMAIHSSFSQLFQESYGFKIAKAADIEDLSILEGAAMLKRYDIELSVYAWYVKTVKPGYLIPPFDLLITANDQGTGILKAEVTASAQLPSL